MFDGGSLIPGTAREARRQGAWYDGSMGDKNPKSKQREKNQKSAEQARAKNSQAARQASFSSGAGKDAKKK